MFFKRIYIASTQLHSEYAYVYSFKLLYQEKCTKSSIKLPKLVLYFLKGLFYIFCSGWHSMQVEHALCSDSCLQSQRTLSD